MLFPKRAKQLGQELYFEQNLNCLAGIRPGKSRRSRKPNPEILSLTGDIDEQKTCPDYDSLLPDTYRWICSGFHVQHPIEVRIFVCDDPILPLVAPLDDEIYGA